MKVFLKSMRNRYEAIGEYFPDTRKLIVKAGSKVSENVSEGKFRSTKAVLRLRNSGCLKNGILIGDIEFKSPSTAANFVTGTSTNGMMAWKDSNGNALKNL